MAALAIHTTHASRQNGRTRSCESIAKRVKKSATFAQESETANIAVDIAGEYRSSRPNLDDAGREVRRVSRGPFLL